MQAEGPTLFDAIRNSKKRLINKLYGGNLQTLLISRQVAETEGVAIILEELLRDGEPRETLSVVVSQEETAAEILLTKGIDSNIIAYEIHKMIEEDGWTTASTKNLPMYKAYDVIRGIGGALVLPAVRTILNNEEVVAEANGIALFQGDRLVGFQSPENTKYYLFIVDEIRGGVLSFPVSHPTERVSLEIKGSKTQASVRHVGGQLTIDLNIHTKLNVMELKSQLSISQAEQREALEQLAAQVLRDQISAYFRETQAQTKIDIFGFDRLLYKQAPDTWRAVEANWDALFQSAVLNVTVQADILSAGVLKDY